MKIFFLAVLTLASLSSQAQSVMVRPTVYNFGNSVRVEVRNPSDKTINCSGTITLQTQFGRTESGFFNESIRSNDEASRYYYLMNMADRVLYTTHFINCYKVN